MRRFPTPAALFLFISLILGGTAKLAKAQDEIRPSFTKFSASMDSPDLPQDRLDPKSLLLLIGQQIHETELDCSHFVQYLYEQAGLYYGYAPSRTLYDGMEGFKRVAHPRAGRPDRVARSCGNCCRSGRDNILERIALRSKSVILPITLLAETRQAALPALCWPG